MESLKLTIEITMNDTVTRIKDALDIVDYIGRIVPLKKTGRNFKANCPFHEEKTPSFIVSPDRQIWRCFGSCGEGGDIISFVMKWEGLTFFEALKELSTLSGIPLDTVQFEDKQWKQKESVYSINQHAGKYFSYLLQQNEFGESAKAYLERRGINMKIMQKFSLGYAPSSWDSLRNYLRKKGFSDNAMLDAGLCVKSQSGRVYDRFRNRIMFPIFDARENLIGFSGRLLKEDAKSPKYINTPETSVYHKRLSLFGIQFAKDAIRKEDNVYVVEGEFDMIIPFQMGVSNIVAIKGSALTKEQLHILKRYTKTITLALDSDSAGEEAIKRGVKEAEKLDFDIQIVQFSKGKDPDEAARNDFVTFKKELQNPHPLYDYLIDRVCAKYPNNTSLDKKRIGEEIAEYLKDIRNPIVKSHYTKKLASLLNVSMGSVHSVIQEKAKKKMVSSNPKIESKQTGNRFELIQKYFLSYLLQQEDPKKYLLAIEKFLHNDDLTIPSYQQIFSLFVQYLKNHKKKSYSYKEFVQTVPNELVSVSDEIFLFISSYTELTDVNFAHILYDLSVESSRYHSALHAKDISEAGEKKYRFFKDRLQTLLTEGRSVVEKGITT